jgi:hypothetical protein
MWTNSFVLNFPKLFLLVLFPPVSHQYVINCVFFHHPFFFLLPFSPPDKIFIQGDFESCADILIIGYWLHVELGKNI